MKRFLYKTLLVLSLLNVDLVMAAEIDYSNICGNSGVSSAMVIIGYILLIAKWIVPLIIMVLGMVDFGKAAISNDEKAINKASGALVRRFIAGIVIFFVPTIISAFTKNILKTNIENEFLGCTSCMFNPVECQEQVKLLKEQEKEDVEVKREEYEEEMYPAGTITNDGVIVSISINTNENIKGYYFNYSKTIPNKETGGYLSTSEKEFDVVRLPGTTYVWVEYSSGVISEPMTIKLSNDVLQSTLNKYTVLKGTKLSDYISKKGDSIEDLNKLIARSVRAAGLYTKTGAATAGAALNLVLVQKYGIKIPYWMGGKTNAFGAFGSWGAYQTNPTYEGYNYYGMDCGGFVNWTYKNTGIEYSSMNKNNYFFWDGIEYSKENGEVGDILRRFATASRYEHVAIIIGKTDSSFIVAEAYGEAVGVVINTYPYDKADGYTIIKGERLFENYNTISKSDYPSGF